MNNSVFAFTKKHQLLVVARFDELRRIVMKLLHSGQHILSSVLSQEDSGQITGITAPMWQNTQ